MSLIICTRPECQTTAGCRCNQAADEIERLQDKLVLAVKQIDAQQAEMLNWHMQLTAKDEEIERLKSQQIDHILMAINRLREEMRNNGLLR